LRKPGALKVGFIRAHKFFSTLQRLASWSETKIPITGLERRGAPEGGRQQGS